VLPRQFASQKGCSTTPSRRGSFMCGPTPSVRYELVYVRTRSGVRRALPFPKAILQAEFEANRERFASDRGEFSPNGS
jgi:hypothetical protein